MNPKPDVSAAWWLADNRGVRRTRMITIVSVLTALGLGLGYARDAGLAALFGASGMTDAFFVATLIPTMMGTVVMAGALGPALLPVWVGLLEDKNTAWSVINAILTGAGLVLFCFMAALILGRAAIIRLLAPGFDPGRADLAARLVLITAPAVVFLGLAALVGIALNALGVYSIPALGGALVNGLALVALFLLARPWGIEGAALGIAIGALAQLWLQMVAFRRLGWTYRPSLNLGQPALREIVRLFIPLLAFVLLAQAVPFIERIVGSGFAAGQLSRLVLASKLYQIPSLVLSGSIAVVMFPILSREAVGGNSGNYRAALGSGIRNVFLLTMPFALWLFLAPKPIVGAIFQHGAFTAEDTHVTAGFLRLYSLSIIPYGFLLILTRAFHSMRDMATPLIIGIINTAIYIVAAVGLSISLNLAGLPLAFLIALVVGLILSFLVLSFRLRSRIGELTVKAFFQVSLAALGLALGVAAWLSLAEPRLAALPASIHALLLGLFILVSGLIYLGLAKLAGVPEAGIYLSTFWSFRQGRNKAD